MRVLGVLTAVALAVAAGGCGRAGPATPPSAPWSGPGAAARTGPVSTGWEITVYYTAVQEFHHGEPKRVTGCPRLDCAHGDDDLGTYPADFVTAVQDEGTGRTAAGRYLNWSYDVGYWLDTVARDSHGNPLEPYVSAAADPDVLRRGSRFTIADCGRQDDGSPPRRDTCDAFRAPGWRVDDEFTPGLGGRKHVDVYVGPETGPGFTGSDLYITLTGATLRMG